MKWRARREYGLYPPRGLGCWIEGGGLGSTYGEPGCDRFREIHILLLWLHWTIRFDWKSGERP